MCSCTEGKKQEAHLLGKETVRSNWEIKKIRYF